MFLISGISEQWNLINNGLPTNTSINKILLYGNNIYANIAVVEGNGV